MDKLKYILIILISLMLCTACRDTPVPARIKQCEKDLEIANNIISAQKDSIKTFDSTIAVLLNQIEDIKESAKLDSKQKSQKIATLTAQVKSLGTQIKDIWARANGMFGKIQHIKNIIANNSEHPNDTIDYAEVYYLIKQSLDEYAEFDRKDTKNTDITRNYYESLQIKINNLEDYIVILQERIKELEKQLTEVRQEYKKLEEKYNNLQRDYNETKKLLSGAKQQIEILEEQIKTIKKQLEVEGGTNVELRNSLKQKENELSSLKKTIGKYEKDIDEWKKKFTADMVKNVRIFTDTDKKLKKVKALKMIFSLPKDIGFYENTSLPLYFRITPKDGPNKGKLILHNGDFSFNGDLIGYVWNQNFHYDSQKTDYETDVIYVNNPLIPLEERRDYIIDVFANVDGVNVSVGTCTDDFKKKFNSANSKKK